MQYPVRITLPLADGVIERIDALVTGEETRLDLIRDAIDKEVKRRAKAQKTQGDGFSLSLLERDLKRGQF